MARIREEIMMLDSQEHISQALHEYLEDFFKAHFPDFTWNCTGILPELHLHLTCLLVPLGCFQDISAHVLKGAPGARAP